MVSAETKTGLKPIFIRFWVTETALPRVALGEFHVEKVKQPFV